MFGIFDLAFSKIVDPTIFVRESFIFAGNSLARRAGAFFFTRNSFARRTQFLRPSPPILSRIARPCSSRKSTSARRKEAVRGGKKKVARGEESSRGNLPRRGKYGHNKESKILGISKLPSHCAYAKMPSLVHQMPSLPKCISPMQNCWRAILRFLANFKNAKSNCITVGDALTEQS